MQAYEWNQRTTSGDVAYVLRPLTKTGFPCDERAYGFGDLFVGLCMTPESSARMVEFIEHFVPDDSTTMKDHLHQAAAHPGPVLVAYTSEWLKLYLLDGDDPLRLWKRFLALEACSDSILEIEKECDWTPEEMPVG